ncbi:MAG TPA: hypothetical protein VHX38_18740 [Pseudonocardiaceae bacterium]|jgi:hypothetical protein|nr:hypothetical protein [Pseudonocardiaceae bacterium]
MARTTLTPVALVRDAGVAIGSGATPDAVNGNIVASPGPYHAKIMVKNADSATHTLKLRSASYTGVASGAANSSMLAPQNTVFTQGTVGDLSVTVAAGATEVVEITTTDRFTQVDGSMWLDWDASTSMTVWVLTEPYVVA